LAGGTAHAGRGEASGLEQGFVFRGGILRYVEGTDVQCVRVLKQAGYELKGDLQKTLDLEKKKERKRGEGTANAKIGMASKRDRKTGRWGRLANRPRGKEN